MKTSHQRLEIPPKGPPEQTYKLQLFDCITFRERERERERGREGGRGRERGREREVSGGHKEIPEPLQKYKYLIMPTKK